MSDVKGAILVVDDEPSLIETVTRALTGVGYFAVGATSADANPQQIDHLLSAGAHA